MKISEMNKSYRYNLECEAGLLMYETHDDIVLSLKQLRQPGLSEEEKTKVHGEILDKLWYLMHVASWKGSASPRDYDDDKFCHSFDEWERSRYY